MDKPQPILRRLHPWGPNCALLNQVAEDLASLRKLVPKLDTLHQEDLSNDLWQNRHTEAVAMLKDYETRYAAMVKVRERALRTFRRLRPKLNADFIAQHRNATKQGPLKPELETRFQSLIEEMEDLVFEFAVTETQDEQKRTELLALFDSLSVQVQMVSDAAGLRKANDGFREAALQISRYMVQAQAAEAERTKAV